MKGDSQTNKKMYLYLFHLFESVVSHTSALVQKTTEISMSQIKIPKPPAQQEPQKETLTTIVTDKSENATK